MMGPVQGWLFDNESAMRAVGNSNVAESEKMVHKVLE